MRSNYQRWDGRIKTLKRRQHWIADRAIDIPGNSHDLAEASALKWAIPILEEWLKAHNEADND